MIRVFLLGQHFQALRPAARTRIRVRQLHQFLVRDAVQGRAQHLHQVQVVCWADQGLEQGLHVPHFQMVEQGLSGLARERDLEPCQRMFDLRHMSAPVHQDHAVAVTGGGADSGFPVFNGDPFVDDLPDPLGDLVGHPFQVGGPGFRAGFGQGIT